MRLFKFFAVFAIVLGLVYTVIIGLNLNVFKTVFSNQEALAEGSEWVEKTFSLSGLVDFIQVHPQNVSVSLNDIDSDTISAFNGIKYEFETPRTMAGTGHFILLAAYADQVASGRINPDSTISRQSIERFFIPGHEPNKHKESIALLRSRSGSEDNFRLDDVVAVMVRRNHQPSADLIFSTIGKAAIEEFINENTDDGIPAPALWSAFHLANLASGQTHHLEGNRDSYGMYFNEFENRLINEPGTDASTILKALGISSIDYTFFEEKNAYENLPKALPSSIEYLIRVIFDTEQMPGSPLERIKQHMAWPMENPKVTRDFQQFFAMYDNRISISNGIAVGTSVYTGRTQISTVFFDRLPVGFWMHMSSNLINQDFQMRLMYDPALFEQTYNLLMLNRSYDGQPKHNNGET